MDAYLKAWVAFAIVAAVAGSFKSPASNPATTTGSTTTFGTPAYVPPVAGTAHVCWSSGGTLNGCRDDTTAVMLFGSAIGSVVTCYFVEPLLPGQYAKCR